MDILQKKLSFLMSKLNTTMDVKDILPFICVDGVKILSFYVTNNVYGKTYLEIDIESDGEYCCTIDIILDRKKFDSVAIFPIF